MFFFDEAHLLFKDAPAALLEKIEQVVRLIRSKGVGVYFVSQNPTDIPDTVLGQLGHRACSTPCAPTPPATRRPSKHRSAQTMRPNPGLDIEAAITELAVGEALVSLLDPKGQPTPTQRVWMAAPGSRIGPATAAERQALLGASTLAGKYDQALDRESAYEILLQRTRSGAEAPAGTRGVQPKAPAAPSRPPSRTMASPASWAISCFGSTGPRGGRHDGVVQSVAKSMVRNAANQLVRGLLGSLVGGRRRLNPPARTDAHAGPQRPRFRRTRRRADLARCRWCTDDPLYVRYHDTEWGVPSRDPSAPVFEMLILEGFQAGLSWLTILRWREALRAALLDFDPEALARTDEAWVQDRMQDAAIIRNRLKLRAAGANARAWLALPDPVGLVWSVVGDRPLIHHYAVQEDAPVAGPEAEALSRLLKRHGFTFVGLNHPPVLPAGFRLPDGPHHGLPPPLGAGGMTSAQAPRQAAWTRSLAARSPGQADLGAGAGLPGRALPHRHRSAARAAHRPDAPGAAEPCFPGRRLPDRLQPAQPPPATLPPTPAACAPCGGRSNGLGLAWLPGRGLAPRKACGPTNPACGFRRLSPDEGLRLARRFGQNALVWCGPDAVARLAFF